MPSSHHSLFPRGIFSGLWVLLQLVIVYAVVLPAEVHQLLQSNHTLFANSNDIQIHCSYDQGWVDNHPFFDSKECFGSIYYMMHEEHAEPNQDRPVTFSSHRNYPGQGHGAIQMTPRKYSPCM